MSTLSVGTIKSVSSAAPVFQNSSGSSMGQLTQGWVNFAGGNVNSFGIRNSNGVSSVTDHGSAEFTITFSTAFANTNYAVVACSSGDPSIHRAIGLIDGGSSGSSETTTTSCGMNNFSTSAGGSHEGSLEIGVAFFGDQ